MQAFVDMLGNMRNQSVAGKMYMEASQDDFKALQNVLVCSR